MQSDLSQAVAEKDAAEQEISAAKLSSERVERQARQEQNRLQSEINSYKQRLERADADLVHCRRENLRLSEQIASLEKEVEGESTQLLRSLRLTYFSRFSGKPEQDGQCRGASNTRSDAPRPRRQRQGIDVNDNGHGDQTW